MTPPGCLFTAHIHSKALSAVFLFVRIESSRYLGLKLLMMPVRVRHHQGQTWTYSAKGPWNKSLNFIFRTKYGIPKSLKVSHWLSQWNIEVKCDGKSHQQIDTQNFSQAPTKLIHLVILPAYLWKWFKFHFSCYLKIATLKKYVFQKHGKKRDGKKMIPIHPLPLFSPAKKKSVLKSINHRRLCRISADGWPPTPLCAAAWRKLCAPERSSTSFHRTTKRSWVTTFERGESSAVFFRLSPWKSCGKCHNLVLKLT